MPPNRTRSRRQWVIIVALCGIAIALVGVVTPVAGADTPESAEIEVVVVFEDPTTDNVSADDPVAALHGHANDSLAPLEKKADANNGLDVEERYWIVPAAQVRVNTSVVTLDALEALDGVTTVTSNAPVMELAEGPLATSAETDTTYGLDQLHIQEAWAAYETKGAGSTVAVLDTGADPDHQDIDVAKWADFSDDPSSDPMDYADHGTHVAGTIVGDETPDGTAYGVAPAAELHVGAVATECDPRCTGTLSTVLDGMQWAVESDVDVISMSLGTDQYSVPMINATRHAKAADTAVVAAIGNDGDGTSISPGNVYDTIAVGATDQSESVWSHSSGEEIDTDDAWGDDAPDDWPETYVVPDVVAPGVQTTSAVPGDDYSEKTGTSTATPHVAGVAALMQSATDEHISPTTTRLALQESAVHPDDTIDARYGHGIVDAPGAIGLVRESGSIDGTITEAITDDPVAEATITVTAGERDIATTTTDTSGQFVLEELPSRNDLTITVTAAGYHATEQSIALEPDASESIEETLEGNAVIDITVADTATDTPLSASAVSLERDDGASFDGHWETDADGVITIPVPGTGATYTATVDRAGYESGTGTTVVDDGETTSLDIALTGDGQIDVAAIDERFDRSVENATVTATSDRGTYSMTETTDGMYTQSAIPSDISYTIAVHADGYESTNYALETVESDTTATVDLRGNATVRIDPRDAITDATLDQVDVTVTSASGHTATIDQPSEFALPGTGEEYEITTERDGYLPNLTAIAVESGAVHESTARMTGDGSLLISVVDGLFGGPVTDASITAETTRGSYPVTERTGGDVVIEPVPSDLVVSTTTAAPGYENKERDVDPNAESASLNLTGSATIDVRVESTDGEPIEDALVFVAQTDGDSVQYPERTGADGTVAVSVPGTDTRYTVSAETAGYHPAELTTEELHNGERTDVTLLLESDDAIPGFGVVVAGAGLVGALAIARRYPRS